MHLIHSLQTENNNNRLQNKQWRNAKTEKKRKQQWTKKRRNLGSLNGSDRFFPWDPTPSNPKIQTLDNSYHSRTTFSFPSSEPQSLSHIHINKQKTLKKNEMKTWIFRSKFIQISDKNTPFGFFVFIANEKRIKEIINRHHCCGVLKPTQKFQARTFHADIHSFLHKKTRMTGTDLRIWAMRKRKLRSNVTGDWLNRL
jgi:hypothetical protein